MIYKKDNQVANISDGGTGYIITTELSGFGDELKHTIERSEAADFKEWEGGSDDDWLLPRQQLSAMVVLAELMEV